MIVWRAHPSENKLNPALSVPNWSFTSSVSKIDRASENQNQSVLGIINKILPIPLLRMPCLVDLINCTIIKIDLIG